MTALFNQTNKSRRHDRKKTFFLGVILVVITAMFAVFQSDIVRTSKSKVALSSLDKVSSKSADTEYQGVKITTPDVNKDDVGLVSNPLAGVKFVGSNDVKEVCGLSNSEAKAFVALSDTNTARMQSRPLTEIISKFAQSNNLREKTLGLYTLANLNSWAAMEAERLNYPGCKRNDACATKPYEALMQARSVHAEPLVKLASISGDINVYAAALYACSGAKIGACSTVTYAHLAEMEPDNAAAWLMAASEAMSRKDFEARDSALIRAVSARAYETHVPLMAPFFTAELLAGQLPLEQASIMATLTGVNSTTGQQLASGLSSYCGLVQGMDDTRRGTCSTIATKLAKKGETLAELVIASKIGEQIGWSDEHLQPLRDEFTFITGQLFKANINEDRLSCDALINSNQQKQKSLTIGERAAAREFVKSSNKNLAELAAGYRKTMPIFVK